MPRENSTSTPYSFNTGALEDALASACASNLQIIHRLELRRLVTSLRCDVEMTKSEISNQNYTEPLRALKNFKANLCANSDPAQLVLLSRSQSV